MTTTTTAPPRNPRATKRYKAMIAAKVSDADALTILGREDLIKPEGGTADLVAGGFSEEQAAKILASGAGKKAKKSKKGKKAKAEKDPKKVVEALVAKQGLAFTRGRVYSNPAIIEGQVRVLKTGKAEIVATSGTGRVSHVLIVRESSGDVSVQNLHKPA